MTPFDSGATVPSLSTTLYITNPLVLADTSIDYTFTSNLDLAVNDIITVAFPDFTLSSVATPTTSGCGTTSFTVAEADSASATASLALTVRDAAITAGVACIVSISSGVIISAAVQSVEKAKVWYDSGIRLTVSKVVTLSYSSPSRLLLAN